MIRNSELLRNGYSIYANASRDKKSALLLSRNIQLISKLTRPSSGSFFLHWPFLRTFLKDARVCFLFDSGFTFDISIRYFSQFSSYSLL